MQAAPLPTDENARQAALDELELLDTPAEPYLDTLVRLAYDLFQVDSVLISLVDRRRQWFKARIGLDASETARDISFCGHAVAARQPLVIEDALQDIRFVDNPLVTGAPFVRFYAGQPLFGRNNQAIGTLCLLSTQPRQLTVEELERLRQLGFLTEGYLRLRAMSRQLEQLRQAIGREQRKAMLDPLTQLWNRTALREFYPREQARIRQAGLQLGVLYADLDHFKQVNDLYGHGAGDQILWQSARRMSSALRPEDLLVRLGGEEFVVLAAVQDSDELAQIAERVRLVIAASPFESGEQRLDMTISQGAALALTDESLDAILARADRGLYQAKQQGRNQVMWVG